MDIEKLFEGKSGKIKLRTIKRNLPCVLNVRNYTTPKDVDEMIKVGWLNTHLEIDGLLHYFKDNSKKAFLDIVENMYNLKMIRDNNSYASVYREVKGYLEKWLPEKKCDHIDFIKTCLCALFEKQGDHAYFSAIEGVVLDGIRNIDLGVMQVSNFENYINEIKEKYSLSGPENNFIEKNCQGQIVIRGEVFGDLEKSKEKFDEQCKLVVSLLRFIALIFYPQSHSRDYVSINFPHERSSEPIKHLTLDVKNKDISYGWSAAEPSVLPINKEIIDTLREDFFFDDLISFMWSQETSEIEDSIITAIHWIGEGQNEKSLDNAFIKYWTAIETVFSIGDENVTENIAKGLSVMLVFGGYRIIKIEEKEQEYKKIKKLYDKRSKVIHRGLRKEVSREELVEISEYAKWVVLTLLGLRQQGYLTLAKLKSEADRLHNLCTDQR